MIYFQYKLKKDYPKWSGCLVFNDSIFDRHNILQETIDEIIDCVEKDNNDEIIEWSISDQDKKGVVS